MVRAGAGALAGDAPARLRLLRQFRSAFGAGSFKAAVVSVLVVVVVVLELGIVEVVELSDEVVGAALLSIAGEVVVVVVVVVLSAGCVAVVEPCMLESLFVCAETKPTVPRMAAAARVALKALDAFMEISFR
jgi:fumarate reductase subunit D